MPGYKFFNYAFTAVYEIEPTPYFTYRLVMDKLKRKYSVFTEKETYHLRLPYKLTSTCVSIEKWECLVFYLLLFNILIFKIEVVISN